MCTTLPFQPIFLPYRKKYTLKVVENFNMFAIVSPTRNKQGFRTVAQLGTKTEHRSGVYAKGT